MTDADLQALCETWQERLRLRDWRVTASFVRHHELDRDKAGNVAFNIQRRAARIKVLVPEDEPLDGDKSLSVEGALVHELLHLHLIHYEPEGVEEDVFEQALNAIAAALAGRDTTPGTVDHTPRCYHCGELLGRQYIHGSSGGHVVLYHPQCYEQVAKVCTP